MNKQKMLHRWEGDDSETDSISSLVPRSATPPAPEFEALLNWDTKWSRKKFELSVDSQTKQKKLIKLHETQHRIQSKSKTTRFKIAKKIILEQLKVPGCVFHNYTCI